MKTLPLLQGEVAFNALLANQRPAWSRAFGSLIILFLLVMGSNPAQARIIYVNCQLQTDPVPTGEAWATAWNTIGDAMNGAADGDEIWVAQGTYKEFVVITNAVALYGGFVGTETNRDQRNFTSNTTTIYGDGGGTNLTRNVVSILAVTNDLARLDGFTVGKDPMVNGSAICTTNSSPVIANNRVSWLINFSDGVIVCSGSSPLITNNYIANNGIEYKTRSVPTDLNSAGGIACINSDAHIVGNRILGNNGGLAGAIRIRYGAPLIAFNEIIANATAGGAGGVDCWKSSANIHNNKLIGNAVVADSIYRSAGGIDMFYCANIQLANNLLMGNYKTFYNPSTLASADSGSIYCEGSAGMVINNTIVDNQGGVAAGFYSDSRQVLFLNNVSAFNSSGVGGTTNIPCTNNCVYANGTRNFVILADQTGTNGNIGLDPMLDGDSHHFGWHLLQGSPCVGAGGTNLVSPDWRDIDGQPRMRDSLVDIGADAFQEGDSTPPPVVCHVSPTGDDRNDGLSWATATRTVQAAMDRAVLTAGEVWVAGGLYPERITLRPYVDLYGGFAGGETNRDQRDWNRNATILDGQRQGSVIRCVALAGKNHLDGFTIQNGLSEYGGGILVRYSSPVIANNVIQNNSTSTNATTSYIGGGVYSEYSALVLSNNIIKNNIASAGGGVGLLNDTGDVIMGNTIQSNRALVFGNISSGFGNASGTGGGAICAVHSHAQIENNLFDSNIAINQANLNTTNTSAFGGAIFFVENIQNTPAVSFTNKIFNNTFIGNLTINCTESGGIELRYCTNMLFANNLLTGNSSGITTYRSGKMEWLNNCVFSNTAFNYSGIDDQTGTNGNISADPLFIPGTSQLSANSPCIDAGNDAVVTPYMVDLLGALRLQGMHVDIGAYEYASADDWAAFVPEAGAVLATPVTVGGITYVPWRFEFADSKYRMMDPATVSTDGTNFIGRFNLEQWSGSETPGTNILAGTFVLGALSPGDYTLVVNVSSNDVKTVLFSVSAEKAATLTWQPRAEDVLKLQVLGVADVTYRLLCATNLVNWEILSTHHGAPFDLDITNNPDIPTLFYRVEIVK